MRNDQGRDEEMIIHSDDVSENAAVVHRLNGESVAGNVVSHNNGDGPDPLATQPSGLECDAPGSPDTQRPRKACQPATLRYYDVARHWTKRIEPHLQDELLNKILITDFNAYTQGRWGIVFRPGMYPEEFESCDWRLGRRGRPPRYWRYVKHGACHFIVNFCLRLATLAEPSITWRILTSDEHSTVWDGHNTLFEFNYLALGIPPEECFANANDKELLPGEYLVG